LQVIAAMSKPFCATCNRIRVTADGFAKPCLHSAEEIDLNGLRGKDLEDALRRAILAKPAGHTLASGSSGSLRDMSRIGG
jgi:cyclic pyranopterin phosphate synthase